MKTNYRAWIVSVADFYRFRNTLEQLHYLLNFAVLAPSSHNSQPWRFEVDENSISVYPEKSRRLPESDKNDRQLYISLGCAIQNIFVAADYYGFSHTIKYLLPNDCAAKIILTKDREVKNEDHPIFAILTRTNNRNKYESRLPDSDFFQKIEVLEEEGVKLSIITEKTEVDQVANIALDAGVAAMDDKDFRRELSQYVKPNTTKSEVGMPGFGLGIPTPISFVVPTLLKWVNVNRLSRKSDEALLKKHTPAFIVISTKEDQPRDWIIAGQVYEKIALRAEQVGLKTAVWAAPIQIRDYYKDLQKVIKTDFRPQVFFRVGYTNKVTRHSPRMSTEFLKEHARYF